MSTRLLKGEVYSPATRKISKAGNEYAIWSFKAGNEIYRFRAFGDVFKSAIGNLKQTGIKAECEVKIDADADGDIVTGVCNSFRLLDGPLKQAPSQVSKKDKAIRAAHHKRMWDKHGQVLARTIGPIPSWVSVDYAVHAFGQNWCKIDFCLLMLGEDIVTKIMKEFGVLEVSLGLDIPRYKECLNKMTELAYADFKSGQEPRLSGVKFQRKAVPDSTLQSDTGTSSGQT